MRVLFLALGDYRRRAVIDEATTVLRQGGSATVLVGDLSRWSADVFPDGITVLDISQLESDHLPLRIERKVVFGVPRRLLKAAGRGPFRRRSKRAWKFYERRIAKPVHRRAMTRYKQIWHDRRHQMVMAQVARGRFEYINVTDYLSMAVGARILSDLRSSSESPAKVSFGVDYVR